MIRKEAVQIIAKNAGKNPLYLPMDS